MSKTKRKNAARPAGVREATEAARDFLVAHSENVAPGFRRVQTPMGPLLMREKQVTAPNWTDTLLAERLAKLTTTKIQAEAKRAVQANTLNNNRRQRHELEGWELAIIARVIRMYPRYGLKALCKKCRDGGIEEGRIGPKRMREIRAQKEWPPQLPSSSGL